MAWGENLCRLFLKEEQDFLGRFRIAFPLIIIAFLTQLCFGVLTKVASAQRLVAWFRVRDSHVPNWFFSLS